MTKNIVLLSFIIATLLCSGCGIKGGYSVQAVPKTEINVTKPINTETSTPKTIEKSVNLEPNRTMEEMKTQILALFPEDNIIQSWRKSEQIALFDVNNLYEHIDGSADAFFAYGFQLCGTIDYVSGSNPDDFVRIDAYDMGKSIQAFGMYASERYPGLKPLDIGVQGYVESSSIIFWDGVYYVKISLSSENLIDVGMKLAKYIADKIPGNSEKPDMLSLLPEEGLIPDTERFILSNILGYDFFENGVTANYKLAYEDKSLIIMKFASSDVAKERLAKFTQFEQGFGAITKITDLGEEGFIANDKYYKRIMVIRQGQYLIVTLGITNDVDARGLIGRALEKQKYGE